MPTLDWIGKKAVLNHHRQVPYHVLKQDPSLSVGDPASGNLLVQGDNLLALKALLPYYAGKVKCIYIDPPYNTGNENWIYNDAVNSPEMKHWLGKVVGAEVEDLSRHDKWLCMMYPRLSLLRDFLTDDGVILISIGRDEIGHLRLLADEIFGSRNLLEILVWNTEGHTENQEQINTVHEYILAYGKMAGMVRTRDVVDPDVPGDSKIRRNFAENSITKNTPKNPASLITLPVGFPCQAESLRLPKFDRAPEFIEEVSKIGYITRQLTHEFGVEYPVRLGDMIVENYALVEPCRVFSGWSSARKLANFIARNSEPLDDEGTKLSFYLTDRGVIYYRREGRKSRYVQSVLRNLGTTERNRYELEAMGVHFLYPKPKELIKYLLSLVTEGSDIILDSFLGSGTTAHAVMLLNTEDRGTRRFIGIELEEHIAKDVAQRRLKCVVEGYTAQRGQNQGKPIEGLGGGFHYCALGEPLFDDAGNIQKGVKFPDLARHIFFTETGQPVPKQPSSKTPLLGVHNGKAVYLLFNGLMGDSRLNGGNVLTNEILRTLPPHNGIKVVYGEGSRISPDRLKREGIIFKQIPYAIKTT